MCASRVTRHTSIRYSSSCHTRPVHHTHLISPVHHTHLIRPVHHTFLIRPVHHTYLTVNLKTIIIIPCHHNFSKTCMSTAHLILSSRCKDVLFVLITISDYYNLELNIWNSDWLETTRSRSLIFLSQGTNRYCINMRRIKASLLQCYSSFQNSRQTMTALRYLITDTQTRLQNFSLQSCV